MMEQNEKIKFKDDFSRRLIKFSVNTLQFCEKMRKFPILWPVADQLARSGTSVGANVAEAKSSSSRKDYTHFFEIALKSANETKYWFVVTSETKPELAQPISSLQKETEEISKIIASSILTLKGKK